MLNKLVKIEIARNGIIHEGTGIVIAELTSALLNYKLISDIVYGTYSFLNVNKYPLDILDTAFLNILQNPSLGYLVTANINNYLNKDIIFVESQYITLFKVPSITNNQTQFNFNGISFPSIYNNQLNNLNTINQTTTLDKLNLSINFNPSTKLTNICGECGDKNDFIDPKPNYICRLCKDRSNIWK